MGDSGLTVPGSDFEITVFRCANCARPLVDGRLLPALRVDWPFAAREIDVPCSGRIQPEHLLKAFEAGADAVVVVGCERGNCHYIEGNDRAERRVDFVRRLMEEAGLERERLVMLRLPGSAREEPAANGERSTSADGDEDELRRTVAEVRRELVDRLNALQPSPLRRLQAVEI